jgi:hypothetical protein
MKHKIAAIVGLLAGCSLLLYWGGEAPPWLLRLECLAVMAGALFFGFSAWSPSAPSWFRHDAVKGVALVYLGVGAVFLPTNLLLSAFLIGSGCKLVMKSAAPVVKIFNGMPLSRTGEIVIREATTLEKHR